MLLTIVAVAGIAVAAQVTIDRSSRGGLQQTIDTDIAGLTDIMVKGGAGELVARFADRTDFADGPPAGYYRLSDSAGHRLAGNLGALPGIDAAHSAIAEVRTPDDRLLVRATMLRGGLTVVVGSLRDVEALQARVRLTFLLAGLAVVIISLLVSLAAAGQVARRVEAINRTFPGFEGGDRSVRSPVPRGEDELARLARHLDSHLDWAQRLLTAQRENSDNIADELRTPLVHLDTRLLHAIDHNRNAGVAADLDVARGDVSSIVSLFDALLDLAFAEAGSGTAARGPVDISELAAGLADLYAASAEEAGLDFSTRIAPGVMLRGEAMALTRLSTNLFDNAIKHVPPGTRVRLIVAAGPIIAVEDDCTGVAPHDREPIFRRFHRVGGGSNGHGLGLALVRVIAAQHDLAARAEDAGPGASFVVEPMTVR